MEFIILWFFAIPFIFMTFHFKEEKHVNFYIGIFLSLSLRIFALFTDIWMFVLFNFFWIIPLDIVVLFLVAFWWKTKNPG